MSKFPFLGALLLLCSALVVLSVPLAKENEEIGANPGLEVVARLDPKLGHGVLLQKPVHGLCDSVKQYAGYYNVTTATKNYFYWFFESRSDPTKDPVILWMTGGPGCSSGIALFNEMGPCTVNDDLSTTKNPHSWNSNASMIFIDQPAGTGFSYGADSDYDKNETEVSRDMYNFLQAFFSAHKKFHKNDFYLFGESYGGHFVPATSYAVYKGNKAGKGLHINLKGVGVGNGLTVPEIQYKWFAEMAYKNKVKPLVNYFTYQTMQAASQICVGAINACQKSESACEKAFSICGLSQVTPVQMTGINLYDIREKCKVPPLCYDFKNTEKFLSLRRVTDALGTTGHPWSSCNFKVNGAFHSDWMHHFQVGFPEMLDSGIRVLIYAGEMDYICNYMGNKAWTMELEWSGKAAFNKAGDNKWMVEGKEAGLARSAQGFTFLQVYNGGHMVPMDQPENTLSMVNSFINDKPFY